MHIMTLRVSLDNNALAEAVTLPEAIGNHADILAVTSNKTLKRHNDKINRCLPHLLHKHKRKKQNFDPTEFASIQNRELCGDRKSSIKLSLHLITT